jgi:hypothetical protein
MALTMVKISDLYIDMTQTMDREVQIHILDNLNYGRVPLKVLHDRIVLLPHQLSDTPPLPLGTSLYCLRFLTQ